MDRILLHAYRAHLANQPVVEFDNMYEESY